MYRMLIEMRKFPDILYLINIEITSEVEAIEFPKGLNTGNIDRTTLTHAIILIKRTTRN